MKEDKTVPQLRFPEFTDAWKQRKLREVVKEFYNGKTPYRQNKAYWGGNVNWLTSGDLNRDVVTNTIEKITEEGQKVSRLRIIPKGTLVIAIMGLEAAGTRGNCGILGIDTTINQACMALIANESIATKDFLFQWYKAFGNRLALKFTQGTKQQNYNEELLGNLDISYPSLKEQQQIGAFFTQLDNTITLQQRKLNSLQKLKKGLLQKMFPKKGENITEIRFPEFSDAWKQRKFSDSFDFLQNNTLSRASLNDTSGCAKNVHYGDILVKFGESISAEKADLPFICDREILKKLSNSILKNGDVVIADTAEDMTTGKSCEIVDVDECMPVLAGLHTIPVRPKQKFGKYYLGYYLNSEAFHSQLIPLIQGIKVYSISKSSIKDTVVMFPDDVQEQEKIGSLFNRIDNTITLQQRKLESLQKLKKGLLQQMFI